MSTNHALSLVREAPLPTSEKIFLVTILSHHNETMFASAKTASWWMGLSLQTFYAARKRLLEAGLIKAEERRPKATVYRVCMEPLRLLAESQSTDLR